MLTALSWPLSALSIDTTIIGNGTPGPYPLGWHFVDTASIGVSYVDTTKGIVPPYAYVEKTNGLLFSQPIDSGTILSVHYETYFTGLQKNYSLYERTYLDLRDSTITQRSNEKKLPSVFREENLDISGYKSVGVSFGSQGQMNLEQALEVSIFGKIRDNITLSANLSDQGTSLEGDTREIGEIDRMFVSLDHPRYSITAGDQYVSLFDQGLLQGQKKIKGLSALYRGAKLTTGAYGAISGGKYTVQNIRGRLGFQGPYYLTGQGEADIINPIRGTIKVLVDGKELSEGEQADYIVDYDIASIRFMPTFPISDNSFIQVSYEYKAFDYQRVFLGSQVGFANQDSTFLTKGILWYEADNKEHPIELDFDEVTLQSLKASGDSTPLIPNGRLIHPNDVYTKNAQYRLYKKAFEISVVDTFFVYTPYNSANPQDNKGYYHVWFNQVLAGTGDYVEFTLDNVSLLSLLDSTQIARLDTANYRNDPRGPVYIYLGPGRGNYSCLSSAPAPKRLIGGEVQTRFQPREWLSLSVDVAGEEEDKNLFSDRDDDDNTASATRSTFSLGNNITDRKSLWILGEHLFSSKRFSRELLSAFDRKTLWNREFTPTLGRQLNLWKVSGGGTFIPGFSVQGRYGQFILQDSLLTQRIAYGSSFSPGNKLSLVYQGQFIQHFDSLDVDRYRSDKVEAQINAKHLSYNVKMLDEWQRRLNGVNSGNIGGGLDVKFNPLSLIQSLFYSQYRKGGNSIFLPSAAESRDTGDILIWKQELNHSPVTGWTVSGTSTFQQLRKKNLANKYNRTKVLLVNLKNEVNSAKTGFSTHQQYRLNSERASSYERIYQYVGRGLGTHSYIDSLGDFRPDPQQGTHIATEKEIFNSDGTINVRKSTIEGSWYFKPQSEKITGMLAEVSWQGTFFIDEHIKLDSATLAKDAIPSNTWIPGYSSLTDKNDSLVSFADISYKQDITWRPKLVKEMLVNFNIRPFLRRIRRYNEGGYTYTGTIKKGWKKWKIGVDGSVNLLKRLDKFSEDSTTIRDRVITLKQRFFIIPALSLFTHETIGGSERGKDHGPYYRLQPGMTFRLPGKGWAELSYTWSQVDISGQIEYPMAQGFLSGTSQVIDCIIDIAVGDHFSINGNYRGDYNPKVNKKMQHLVSLEVKAFL